MEDAQGELDAATAVVTEKKGILDQEQAKVNQAQAAYDVAASEEERAKAEQELANTEAAAARHRQITRAHLAYRLKSRLHMTARMAPSSLHKR